MSSADEHIIRVQSPIGRIELQSNGSAVTGLTIERDGSLPHDDREELSDAVLETAAAQLSEYFAGKRHEFDVPVAPNGTEFQRAVWARLGELGWGEHLSYGQIAHEIGRPGSGRAIGGAVGANPIPLLIACHRVLGSTGRITGYSGGNGIPTKVWLLSHESIAHK